ncbi:hypothetical protein [Streptomyces sp. NBC_00268]|uniref:hypothetical protein n=1 Tax=Streptomyces sp. NBC_00268 TaxID=2975695 RepID=UPI002254D11A|nr:hypothetical protein [Streptomyces sp. NBC_00268]MCX5191291.1 hypothetical protein [Streptomyces sp. NBC_00268]
MSADLEQARVAARDTESPHLLGNYEGLRSDPQALVGLLATADKRTDAVIRDVGDVRARLMDDPNLPPVQLPPVVAFRALSPEHLLRDLAHELDAHVRLELRLPGGERRTRWAQPDGRVLAFDPLDPAAPGRSALTSQEAQDAGLIGPELRRAVDELGFDSGQLGAVYRTSWQAGRTFAAAMYEEVENRRARTAEIDPLRPNLPRRAGASADEPKTPPGPNTESADATPEIRAVLDELPGLAGETEPTGSERLAALLEAAETLLGPAPVVRAPEPHQVLRDGPLTVDEPATGLAGEVRGETDDRATAGPEAGGAPEDSTGEGAPGRAGVAGDAFGSLPRDARTVDAGQLPRSIRHNEELFVPSATEATGLTGTSQLALDAALAKTEPGAAKESAKAVEGDAVGQALAGERLDRVWRAVRTWEGPVAEAAVLLEGRLQEAGHGARSLVMPERFASSFGRPLLATNIRGTVEWFDLSTNTKGSVPGKDAGAVRSVEFDRDGTLIDAPEELRDLGEDAVRLPELQVGRDPLRALGLDRNGQRVNVSEAVPTASEATDPAATGPGDAPRSWADELEADAEGFRPGLSERPSDPEADAPPVQPSTLLPKTRAEALSVRERVMAELMGPDVASVVEQGPGRDPESALEPVPVVASGPLVSPAPAMPSVSAGNSGTVAAPAPGAEGTHSAARIRGGAGEEILDDWIRFSSVTGKPRSHALKRIDRAVALLNTDRSAYGAATIVVQAIDAWREGKTGSARWVQVQALRDVAENLEQEYVKAGRRLCMGEVEALTDRVTEMRRAGAGDEQIARELHAERRALGVKYKNLTPEATRQAIYLRNEAKYGDRLGPTIDWLRGRGKTWEQIIDSATRTGGQDLGMGKGDV